MRAAQTAARATTGGTPCKVDSSVGSDLNKAIRTHAWSASRAAYLSPRFKSGTEGVRYLAKPKIRVPGALALARAFAPGRVGPRLRQGNRACRIWALLCGRGAAARGAPVARAKQAPPRAER